MSNLLQIIIACCVNIIYISVSDLLTSYMVKKKYPVLKAQTGIEIAGYAIMAFKKEIIYI
ncbi:hypothetical protein GCM10009120_26070 [Sphingobacterium siyangense subsp. cladoniae]